MTNKEKIEVTIHHYDVEPKHDGSDTPHYYESLEPVEAEYVIRLEDGLWYFVDAVQLREGNDLLYLSKSSSSPLEACLVAMQLKESE